MIAIVYDHFRRWWWIWIVGGLAYAAEMIGVCLPSDSNNANQFFPLGFFLGAFLLATDLQRGHARTLLVLPVSLRQLARAWWWAVVGVPILIFAMLSLLMFGAMSLVHYCHHSTVPIDFKNGGLFWLTNSLLLGTMFFALSGMQGKARPRLSWRQQCHFIFFGVIWVWCILSGMLVGVRHFNSIYGWIVLCAGSLMTIYSWFRAESLVKVRLGLSQNDSGPAPAPPTSYRIQGYGGLPLLIQNLGYTIGTVGVVAIIFVVILSLFNNRYHEALELKETIQMVILQMCWIMVVQFYPTANHLRFLRTLPISAFRLTAVLWGTIFFAIILSIYLLNVIAALFSHLPSPTLLQMIDAGCLLKISIGLVLVPVIACLGMSPSALFIAAIVIICQTLDTYSDIHLSIAQSLSLSALLILASFIATKFLLERNSAVYRPSKNQWISSR